MLIFISFFLINPQFKIPSSIDGIFALPKIATASPFWDKQKKVGKWWKWNRLTIVSLFLLI